MPRERTQLNVNIDPALLLRLKSEAIKQGKTLTDYVVEQLNKAPSKKSRDSLEVRLLRIESLLGLDQKVSDAHSNIGTIFTDEGAKEYGEVAKKEFESFANKQGLTIHAALEQLAKHLITYPHSNPELVFQILLGTHQLTGLEMTLAYRHGSCAMRSALNDWTNSPMEKLNKAFLNAVKVKNLA